MGIRTSNKKTMSIQICASLSVFVCDNLAFRGDLIALNRKHTSGLNLRTELSVAVLRFQDHFGRLTGEIDRLRARELWDGEARTTQDSLSTSSKLPRRLPMSLPWSQPIQRCRYRQSDHGTPPNEVARVDPLDVQGVERKQGCYAEDG